MAGIDLNRTSGGTLPAELSAEILARTTEQSVVQRLARKITLPGRGAVIPVITGEPTAAFVNETDEKPVSNSTYVNKTMTAYTLSFIEPFSNQLKRDQAGLYNELVNRLPQAIGKAFDRAVLFGEGAPGTGFDTLATAPSASITTGTYAALVGAMGTVAANGGDLTGFALAPSGEVALLGAVDTTGRPIFSANATTTGSIGSVLGRPVYIARSAAKAAVGGATPAPATVGFAGDWSRSVWGQVTDIEIAASSEATINKNGTQINLFQRNMFALRCEVEIGFVTASVNDFVRLTGANA